MQLWATGLGHGIQFGQITGTFCLPSALGTRAIQWVGFDFNQKHAGQEDEEESP